MHFANLTSKNCHTPYGRSSEVPFLPGSLHHKCINFLVPRFYSKRMKMDQEEADVKHKFLLIFGSNQKRTDIIGPASGVGKSKILTALLKTFGQNELDGDIQVYDKDFDDYADIEECDLVTGPAKVRLTTTPQQDAVQVLPVKLGMADNVTTICTGEKPGLTKEQMNVLATFMDDVGSNIGVSAGPFRARSSPSPSLSQPASGPPSTLRAAGGPPSTSQTAGGPPSTSQAAGVPPSPSQAAGGPPSPSQAAAGPPSPSQGAGGPPSTSQAAGGPLSPSQSPTPLTGSWNNFSIPPQTPTIEMKLVNGGDSMTETERSLFLDTIYNEVAQKCGLYYPTKTNYDTMIGKIHRTYPKMMAQTPSMSSGNKKLLWKHRLIYKFQNRRRRTDQDLAAVQNRRLNPDRKPRSEQRQARNIRPQWGMSNYLPPREPTEDDTTVASHIKWLATEKRKRQPDFKMVHCCMNRTLADRRKWVVNETPSVSDVQEKYPWLFDEDELLREMNRIRGDDTRIRRELLAGLKKYSTGLIHKGKARKQMHPYFSAAVAELDSSDDVTPDAVAIAAFLAIPGLLQEQVGQIIVADNDETTCPVYIKLDAETPRAATRYTLFADDVEVASTEDCLTALAMWVSTFYVFNMTYPQCATRSLEFVQRVILNITDEMPPSRAILRLTNQLNAFSS